MDAHAHTIWPQLAVVAAVAASHMSMPNHWLPYSLVARAHSWSLRRALLLTAIGAFGHVTVTIAISLLISEIGGAFISHQQYRILSTLLLLLLGVYYFYTYFSKRKSSVCCDSAQLLPSLSKSQSTSQTDSAAVQRTAAISLIMLTTLSPCVGSMPVLVTLMAPPVKPSTVFLAAAVLFLVSMTVCCVLVAISMLGASTIECSPVRKHERLILGVGLLVLAALTYFVFSDDHSHHHHAHVSPHNASQPAPHQHAHASAL